MTTTATATDINADIKINADTKTNADISVATMHEHEIPKYYQGRVLAYLFRNAVLLKT